MTQTEGIGMLVTERERRRAGRLARAGIRLADPVFELVWSDTGEMVRPSATFYHAANAEIEARIVARDWQRAVRVQAFRGWVVGVNCSAVVR